MPQVPANFGIGPLARQRGGRWAAGGGIRSERQPQGLDLPIVIAKTLRVAAVLLKTSQPNAEITARDLQASTVTRIERPLRT